MKKIYLSSMRDKSGEVIKLAEVFNLGIEILDFIELYNIRDIKREIKNIRQKTSNLEELSIHGPFIDLYPASEDPEVVKVVKKRFLEVYKIAKMLNTQHLIFHAGYISNAHHPKKWLNNAITFWRSFISDIDGDIEIHIENVSIDDYLLINELIESINSPIFSACLDIGHVNINSAKTLKKWIKGLNNNIRYVHLHNNDGLLDNHNGLYNGQINVLKTLELLEIYAPNAIWTLETKITETKKSIVWLEQNGFIKKQ